MTSSFRRINVDQYDEEHSFPLNELVPENPFPDDELISIVQSISQQVRAFLQRGDTQSALAAVLSVEPYGSSPALTQAKAQHTASVIEVLNATKSTDISGHLGSLDIDAQDTLMKYLYKGMEQPGTYNTAVLLIWHEKLVEVAGYGSIVRESGGIVRKGCVNIIRSEMVLVAIKGKVFDGRMFKKFVLCSIELSA